VSMPLGPSTGVKGSWVSNPAVPTEKCPDLRKRSQGTDVRRFEMGQPPKTPRFQQRALAVRGKPHRCLADHSPPALTGGRQRLPPTALPRSNQATADTRPAGRRHDLIARQVPLPGARERAGASQNWAGDGTRALAPRIEPGAQLPDESAFAAVFAPATSIRHR
jgi:hypothetical protein